MKLLSILFYFTCARLCLSLNEIFLFCNFNSRYDQAVLLFQFKFAVFAEQFFESFAHVFQTDAVFVLTRIVLKRSRVGNFYRQLVFV